MQTPSIWLLCTENLNKTYRGDAQKEKRSPWAGANCHTRGDTGRKLPENIVHALVEMGSISLHGGKIAPSGTVSCFTSSSLTSLEESIGSLCRTRKCASLEEAQERRSTYSTTWYGSCVADCLYQKQYKNSEIAYNHKIWAGFPIQCQDTKPFKWQLSIPCLSTLSGSYRYWARFSKGKLGCPDPPLIRSFSSSWAASIGVSNDVATALDGI